MKIHTYTDDKGETRFRVLANNGQIILTPHEGYTRKDDAHRAIEDNLGGLVKAAIDGIIVTDEDGTEHVFIVSIDISTRVNLLPIGAAKPSKP